MELLRHSRVDISILYIVDDWSLGSIRFDITCILLDFFGFVMWHVFFPS